mgnify:CR=1 FL=1
MDCRETGRMKGPGILMDYCDWSWEGWWEAGIRSFDLRYPGNPGIHHRELDGLDCFDCFDYLDYFGGSRRQMRAAVQAAEGKRF